MEVDRATVGLMNLIFFYIMTKVEREVGPHDLFFAKSASNALQPDHDDVATGMQYNKRMIESKGMRCCVSRCRSTGVAGNDLLS